MTIDQKIEVIKEGITPHNCGNNDWVIDFTPNTPKDTYVYTRICKECGRVEKVTEQHKTDTFSEVYQRYYGEVK